MQGIKVTQEDIFKCLSRRNQGKISKGGTLGAEDKAVQRNHKWFGNAGLKYLWWSTGMETTTEGGRWG